MTAPWLEIESLCFGYSAELLFDRLSWSSPDKGFVVCTGPSGVGKSTLGLLLCGHLLPRSGRILLDGNPVRGPSRAAIYVAQDDDLFPWLTTENQAQYFADQKGSLRDWGPLLARLGLSEARNLYPHQMSGGMRKRLALLRATLLRPSLLLLDETFASLDRELRECVLADFVPLWQEQGIGALLITHDLSPRMRELSERELRLDRVARPGN
jgi:ABC-type nitrate/sulfonate/bicarbonate transport system ATPase subunit